MNLQQRSKPKWKIPLLLIGTFLALCCSALICRYAGLGG